ncbi:MAG: cobaltochelatase subunit CobN [Geminicoccaceae bacterium]
MRGFIAEANPAALCEIAERFAEAIERGLWRPASNSAHQLLATLGPATSQEVDDLGARRGAPR